MVGSGPFRGWPAGWWLEDGHCAGRVYRRRLELGMATVKEDMIRLIQDQPDDSSFDEILKELAFSRMVDRGLADSKAGRVISHEDMGRRIEAWRK